MTKYGKEEIENEIERIKSENDTVLHLPRHDKDRKKLLDINSRRIEALTEKLKSLPTRPVEWPEEVKCICEALLNDSRSKGLLPHDCSCGAERINAMRSACIRAYEESR